MKKLVITVSAGLLIFFSAKAQHIADKNFAKYIRINHKECIDDDDNLLPPAKNKKGLFPSSINIENIEGIEGFSSLQKLDISDNNISVIPPLPASLTELDCPGNKLKTLPDLPAELTILDCSRNKDLVGLPVLPTSLKGLYCSGTKIILLPDLPPVLITLDCSNSPVAFLPVLPASLQDLNVAGTEIRMLPDLPDNLIELEVNQYIFAMCIPIYSDRVELTYKNRSYGHTKNCTGDPNQHIPDGNFVDIIRKNCHNCIDENQNLFPVAKRLKELVAKGHISSIAGIEFFTALTRLDISSNNLTVLPPLPASLIILDCSWNNLTTLPELPANLWRLDCNSNKNLKTLPALPATLKILLTNNCDLTNLPVLPAFLTKLDCSINKLTALPDLPSGLKELDCSRNYDLNTIPRLPLSLQALEATSCNLNSLPVLPDSLQELYCSNTTLSALPALPASLRILYCSKNPLTGLPQLPKGLTTLWMEGTEIKTIPALPDSLKELVINQYITKCIPSINRNLLVYKSYSLKDYSDLNLCNGTILQRPEIAKKEVLDYRPNMRQDKPVPKKKYLFIRYITAGPSIQQIDRTGNPIVFHTAKPYYVYVNSTYDFETVETMIFLSLGWNKDEVNYKERSELVECDEYDCAETLKKRKEQTYGDLARWKEVKEFTIPDW